MCSESPAFDEGIFGVCCYVTEFPVSRAPAAFICGCLIASYEGFFDV
jgi:hypothetical protein